MAREDWPPDPAADYDIAEGLDPEGPSADDLDRFGSELDPCPECGEAVYDQAEICPHCGNRMMDDPKPLGFYMTVAVLLMIALVVLFVVW